METWKFGIDNDNLIELVLLGKKTATTSLYNLDSIPKKGEESIICFNNEKEACIIKTIDYKIMNFNDMTDALTSLEGEGDLSLDYWMKVHYDYFKTIDSNFNSNSKIIFETFELSKNLVQERLELGKKIVCENLNLFKNIKELNEINSGFNNTLFSVNNKFVIKVCTNYEEENKFDNEYNFYLNNKDNKNIPKLYKYDNTKQIIKYKYAIFEKIPDHTLYYYWPKMTEYQRELIIKKLMYIMKDFHKKRNNCYNWSDEIISKIKDNIALNKNKFNKEQYNVIQKSFLKYKEYLHESSLVTIHNDLHFDNIMYNKGNLKLLDFNDYRVAPIDFEFRKLYICQETPWKWANTEVDSYQLADDYKNIWKYIKKYYEELNSIKYLEERMLIYKILNITSVLEQNHSKETIDTIVKVSIKLINKGGQHE